MFLLGLLLPICFISGYTGVTIATQWVLLSCVLPFSLWKEARLTSFHWLGIAFVGYAFLSMLWTINPISAVNGLWRTVIWALAFWYGTTATTLAPLWKGMAFGLSISTLVAFAQAFGYHPIFVATDQTAGLLYNNTVAGASIALVLIALTCDRAWAYMPIPIVGLALSQSRGAVLVLAVSLICKYIHWYLAMMLLIVGALVFSLHEIPSDSWRLQIWGYAIRGLTFFGWGPDAFNEVYYVIRNSDLHPSFAHPEFVHNDILQLWFSFGIAALVPYTALVYGVTRTSTHYWPVMVGFVVLTTFYFPLYSPLTAFIGCCLAGHLCRGYDPIRAVRQLRRPAFLQCMGSWKPNSAINRSGCVPVEQLHSQSEA